MECCDVERDYKAQGKKVKGPAAQAMISSVLPAEGHGLRTEKRILETNNWLHRWYHQERLGFMDHGLHFPDEGLLSSFCLLRVEKNYKEAKSGEHLTVYRDLPALLCFIV